METHVRNALQSMHRDNRETLKWLWLLVMALAMEEAIVQTYENVVPIINYFNMGTSSPRSDSGDLELRALSIVVFVLVFAPTFLRFFMGDNRYVDFYHMKRILTINENGKSDEKIREELEKLTGARPLFDVLLLLIHGMLFIFLAKSLTNIEVFIFVYTALLFVNSIWLYFSLMRMYRWSWPLMEPEQRDSLRQSLGLPARGFALRIWAQNNFLFAVFLLCLSITYYVYNFPLFLYITLFILFAIFNSAIDSILTWRHYFPKLSDAVPEPQQIVPNT